MPPTPRGRCPPSASTAMNPSFLPCGDSCLWERLQRYRFDPTQVAHPFERRLASAERWPLGKASRVVEEYRRFVYLAVVADHAVTPSRAVDAAWHLHLIDSRRYWEEFCPVVLGRPLHHEPGRGGPSDRAHHRTQYARTLTSYRRCFGTAPPPDIWPVSVHRWPAAPLLWALPALLLVVCGALPAIGGTHPIHRPESLLHVYGVGIGLAVAWTLFWRLQEPWLRRSCRCSGYRKPSLPLIPTPWPGWPGDCLRWWR